MLAVSERLDRSNADFGDAADRVLWFKTGMHVYDVVELAEEYVSYGRLYTPGHGPPNGPMDRSSLTLITTK